MTLALVACSRDPAPTPVTVAAPTTTVASATPAASSASSAPLPAPGATDVEVQAVACDRDGQLGPQKVALPYATMKQHVDPAQAASLRLYSDGETSVLAPSGWKCRGWYGSNGQGLVVAPDEAGLKNDAKGERVSLSKWSWDTSGRLSAAPVAARFPALRAKAQAVKGLPDPLQTTPWPGERVSTLADGKTIRFDDPPNVHGTAGTSTIATAGTVRDTGDSLSLLVVRLVPPRDALVDAIIAKP